MKKLLFIIMSLLIPFLFISCNDPSPPDESPDWHSEPANPLIDWDPDVRIVWNDPCVIKENEIYKMWLSGLNMNFDEEHVRIYSATSSDGISWNLDTTALLEPGVPGSWDDVNVETPMVLEINGIYHLYYCAQDSDSASEAWQLEIGHAVFNVAQDSWIKDNNNPIISYRNDDDSKWGSYQAGEPGVIYKDNKFYLYYTTARSGPNGFQQGIALAISEDGSNFVNYDPDEDGELNIVLSQSAAYPAEDDYVGYSTPFPVIDQSGQVHLFYDVAQNDSFNDWRQVALAHAVSDDGGYSFTEVETNILTYGHDDWKNHEVRAPSVLIEDNKYKMWFAGNNEFFFDDEKWHYGIGYTYKDIQ